MLQTLKIHIRGMVQGVGFRPFVFRMAIQNHLKGSVENRNDGVHILVQGHRSHIGTFLDDLQSRKPLAAHIHSIDTEPVQGMVFQDFIIKPSASLSNEITMVSPDIPVCRDCLADLSGQEHRLDYPFINCTNCGPRFTIIHDLPYDRDRTSMAPFEMCNTCRKEYEDVLDRRFHAQPVACNACGPHYTLYTADGKMTALADIIQTLTSCLENEGIAAIKGMGGYFLACDAASTKAVNKIRNIKTRESKPFAVLFADLDAVREYTLLNDAEADLLTSWKRPIVLLGTRKSLAPGVSMGFPTTGAMLPYMPFHYLLFQRTRIRALVLTSGNLAEEPIIIDDDLALDTFLGKCDAVLTYNRQIVNRVDDSVAMVVGRDERPLRRSRGYVPAPVSLKFDVDGIIATGAELVNCFCLGKGHQAFMSQHIGDLKNLETYEFYTESLERFKQLFRIEPRLVACDLHPDYLSTSYAKKTGLEMVQVQHHHAHIASCMAENGLDEAVIGIAFDGTGMGDDGAIWGGEFLVSDLASYERYSHFEYVPMPGGDGATRNPWRMAVSYLDGIYGDELRNLELPFLQDVKDAQLNTVIRMIRNNINSPRTSSSGRLFDAVSAMLDLCLVSGFHAEAPMRLESVISDGDDDHYDVVMDRTISVTPMIKQIVSEIKNRRPVGTIARKFHMTLVYIIESVVARIHEQYRIRRVVLSGGTFQNRFLAYHTERRLTNRGFEVFVHRQVPCNDGGIALGQIAVAAKKKGSRVR